MSRVRDQFNYNLFSLKYTKKKCIPDSNTCELHTFTLYGIHEQKGHFGDKTTTGWPLTWRLQFDHKWSQGHQESFSSVSTIRANNCLASSAIDYILRNGHPNQFCGAMEGIGCYYSVEGCCHIGCMTLFVSYMTLSCCNITFPRIMIGRTCGREILSL